MNFILPDRYAIPFCPLRLLPLFFVIVIEGVDYEQEHEHDYDGSETAGALAGATSDLFRRALRRFAAFLWMMPRLAALSMAEIIA